VNVRVVSVSGGVAEQQSGAATGGSPQTAPPGVQVLASAEGAQTDAQQAAQNAANAQTAGTNSGTTPGEPVGEAARLAFSRATGEPAVELAGQAQGQAETQVSSDAAQGAATAAGSQAALGSAVLEDGEPNLVGRHERQQRLTEAAASKTNLAATEAAQPVAPAGSNPLPAKGKSASQGEALLAAVRAGAGGKGQAEAIDHLLGGTKAEHTAASDAQQNVDRVVKAAQAAVSRGQSRVQIRLEPPELGYLRIEIRQTADGLHLQLQATSERTQQLLQQNRQDLHAALEASGLQPRQIDIQLRLDLRNEQHREAPGQSFGQEGSGGQSGQQQPSDGQTGGDQPWTNPWQQDLENVETGAAAVPASGQAWQELAFAGLDVRA